MSIAVSHYPTQAIECLALPASQPALIRPVLPQDSGIMQDFVRNLSPKARYTRFQTGVHELSPWLLQRFTALDYGRQMALIAVLFGNGRELVIGDARYAIGGDDESSGEIGFVVADAWQGMGVASRLLAGLVRHAAHAGIARLYGDVLAENEPMLRFARKHGFSQRRHPDGPRLVRVWRMVSGEAAPSHKRETQMAVSSRHALLSQTSPRA